MITAPSAVVIVEIQCLVTSHHGATLTVCKLHVSVHSRI